MELIERRRQRHPQIAQWVAVQDAEWITVDRGTPDNRGGIQSEYRYTLTAAGWSAAGREADIPGRTVEGVTGNGHAWRVEQRGAEVALTLDGGERVAGVSGLGAVGAAGAFDLLVATFGGSPDGGAA